VTFLLILLLVLAVIVPPVLNDRLRAQTFEVLQQTRRSIHDSNALITIECLAAATPG
jgi:hypothetical protein